MSATRDKDQKIAYCGQNLYRIYREKSNTAGVNVVPTRPHQSLRGNLAELEALHARLKLMIAELEELVK